MVDALTLVTQVSSSITLVLVGIAVFVSFKAWNKLKGGGKFEKSILLQSAFLSLFMVAVGVMSLYHWLDSDLFEDLWYLMLNVSLVVGIIASVYAYNFWKDTAVKRK